jgi:hypothetical protein
MRRVIEIVAIVAVVAIVRDLTVALDLLLRDHLSGYASLGVASIIAIWAVVLAIVATIWPRHGRPPVWPPQSTRTTRNAILVIAVLIAVDWLLSFRLFDVVTGSLPIHLPASWLAFAAIAVGGPIVEEWLFRWRR